MKLIYAAGARWRTSADRRCHSFSKWRASLNALRTQSRHPPGYPAAPAANRSYPRAFAVSTAAVAATVAPLRLTELGIWTGFSRVPRKESTFPDHFRHYDLIGVSQLAYTLTVAVPIGVEIVRVDLEPSITVVR
jgi:ferric-dicitrate binding protein FerR (iron transport regulator)